MNNKLNIKDVISNNKWLILIFIVMFCVFLCCGLNTFPSNDDLPYSFFYRGPERVQNIIQVLKNQVADYREINGRFLVHCVVQFVLIFDRVLFSILNAAIIVGTIYLMAYIAKQFISDCKDKKYLSTIICSICFLLLFDFKWLVYWVAGSVNYVWVFFFVLLSLVYYLKTNFNKYDIVNIVLFFLLANIHENSLVVAVILYITIVLEQFFRRKLNIKKLLYIVPLIIGAVILLAAPGNSVRVSSYEDWYSMNIIEKMLISIPALSKAILNVNNGYNLIPAIYILVLIMKVIKIIIDNRKHNINNSGNVIYITGVSLLLINTLLCIITQNGWACFANIILLAFIENYIHLRNKQYNFITCSISMYAVVFSMCITPLYWSLRPNYYLYIYYSILIAGWLVDLIKFKKEAINKIITCILTSILTLLLMFELYIYINIGNVSRIREKEIAEGIKNNDKVIYLTESPGFFMKFHNDLNSVGDEEYWAKKYYYYYYGINSEVDLVVINKQNID